MVRFAAPQALQAYDLGAAALKGAWCRDRPSSKPAVGRGGCAVEWFPYAAAARDKYRALRRPAILPFEYLLSKQIPPLAGDGQAGPRSCLAFHDPATWPGDLHARARRPWRLWGSVLYPAQLHVTST